LERGSLTGVRAAVANLPAPPPLGVALVICLLLRDREPESYERPAVRWLGRLLLGQRYESSRAPVILADPGVWECWLNSAVAGEARSRQICCRSIRAGAGPRALIGRPPGSCATSSVESTFSATARAGLSWVAR
jgi:hypothetical protein